MTVLTISAEAVLQKILLANLQQLGLLVTSENDIDKACEALRSVTPDLIILDSASAPGHRSVLANPLFARAQANGIPLITLVGRNDSVGWGDWPGRIVSKPFTPRQLIDAVRRVLHVEADCPPDPSLSAGGIVLNPLTHRVYHDRAEIFLRPKEFRLLALLMQHIDRVFTRNQLLDEISGDEAFYEERTIDVLVRRLRVALEPHGLAERIETVRGTGYRFCA